jgi:hypothetical protein
MEPTAATARTNGEPTWATEGPTQAAEHSDLVGDKLPARDQTLT